MTGSSLPTSLSKRRTLACLAGLLAAPAGAAPVADHRSPVTQFAPVVPGYTIRFPDDEGSHPEFRLEWWYVTGWLAGTERPELGFQITFFRARPSRQTQNPSTFSPRQMLIAHAALSDPVHGRLLHDQRAARAAFELAGAEEGRTAVWIDDWSLKQRGARYLATIAAREFALDLALAATQPPMLQGESGLSRKGPRTESASYYYSLPHLDVTGAIVRNGRREKVRGTAWLDHEWSSSYLDERASGWDWIGINLDGGGALMAFRIRDRAGATFWAGGAYRDATGSTRTFPPEAVRFVPLRQWSSPRTGTTYPVSWQVRAGDFEINVVPLFDDQENDTRATTGAIYWEGAVRAIEQGRPVGRGYLELTGYWRRLEL